MDIYYFKLYRRTKKLKPLKSSNTHRYRNETFVSEIPKDHTPGADITAPKGVRVL